MADDIEEIRGLVAPVVQGVGVDLVDVSIKGAGPKQKVRVVVDRKGGIEIDQLTAVSRQVSELLDVADPIAGRFTLEVTSPGVDWPLKGQADFDRVEGRNVLIHRSGAPDQGPEQVRGKVTGTDHRGVMLQTKQGSTHVPYDEIAKANQTLPW